MAFTDMVVLLPGILGSALRKGGDEIWSLGAGSLFRALTSLGHNLEALTLDHDSTDDTVDDVLATRLIPDTTIFPGLWRVDGYTRVASRLKERLDLVDGQSYFEFPYDWRRDNRVAARQLSERVPAWLNAHRTRTNNPDAKVWFVGHSMGGLVARYYLEVLGGRSLARGFVTFGTPFRGSMNALNVLVNGLPRGIGPIGVGDLTAMARSFTSMYQLLPTYRCIEDAGTLRHLVDLPSVPQLDAAKLASARAFHREMDEAAAASAREEPRYRVLPFVGIRQPTSLSARLSSTGAVMMATLAGQELGGDGTVPRISATPDEVREAGLERYATEHHASLQNAPELLDQLEGILTAIDVAPFRAPAGIGLSLDVGDLVAPGELLEIACVPVSSQPSGERSEGIGSGVSSSALDLTAYVVHLDTNRTQAVPLVLGPDGWYRAAVRVIEPGAYRVTVRGREGVTPVSDVVAAV